MAVEITSSDLIPIEAHFKVSAGPGSGKTYWLIKHIHNVLRTSDRLVPTTKIACITYTNTGVEEIRKRLSGSLEKVEVSTIHNFLYKYLIKPFLHLINEDANGNPIVNLRRLDGHHEHIVSQGFVIQWLKASKANILAYDKLAVITEALFQLRWAVSNQGEPELICNKANLTAALKTFVQNGDLIDYKKYYWEKGIIHHEDVLFFALELINKKSNLLSDLRNKFPYIFIDEFQDTNPLQTEIVKRISSDKSIVGIIGDAAQSIYSFQGATRQEFVQFSLPQKQNLVEYTIRKNRRSPDEIVNLLNHCRCKDGLVQVSTRGSIGSSPEIVVGDFDKLLKYISGGSLVILCFRNDAVGKFKFSTSTSQKSLWNSVFSKLDDRARKLYNLVYGVECIRQKRLKEGLKYVQRTISVKAHKLVKQQIAIELIDRFLMEYDDLNSSTITQLCNNFLIPFQIEKSLEKISKISRGKIKSFADGVTYAQLAQGISLKDDISKVRTIHKSKGAQFEDVMVYLESESDFKNFIIDADVTSPSDDARLYYVALSRAQNTLTVALPTLSKQNETDAQKIGFGKITRL